MDKDALLKCIAETGYNVGFGAKKHFATYDLVERVPGWITFFSLTIGVLGLVYEPLAQKLPAALLVVVGIVGLYVGAYDSRKADYEAVGNKLIGLFYELRDLYRSVQAGTDPVAGHAALSAIEARYVGVSISKQMFPADWYAHYKFFWQTQIEWIDEQKKFRFFRDKIPLSFMVFCAALLIATPLAVVAMNPPALVKSLVCAKPPAPAPPTKPSPPPVPKAPAPPPTPAPRASGQAGAPPSGG